MWRCKHVADALAEHRYWELPLRRRIALKTHIALCIVCGRYHRQVMQMQELADTFRRREEADPAAVDPVGLPDDAKKRLQDALKRGA